ncbi:MAG: NAD(P)H-dependent oxidoreductase [Candidatus Eisenbacteria bacterium]
MAYGRVRTYIGEEIDMKIMTILGSPKMDGNTAGALAMLERELGEGHEIDRVNLPELDVMGCRGCYECRQKPNEASCVTRDGATDVLRRIVEADAVVYASPPDHSTTMVSADDAVVNAAATTSTRIGSLALTSLSSLRGSVYLLSMARVPSSRG